MSIFLFHFEETLQIGILLTRMKIFSPYVKKHFNALPRNVSIAFFLTCLCIDTPLAFLLKIDSLGAYSYYDASKKQQQTTSFYFYAPSDFSQTLLGKSVQGVSYFFLNLFLSIVVGVALNTVSLLKYKLYVKERHSKDETYSLGVQMSHLTNDNNNNRSIVHELTARKELNERRVEENMFYMALSLCSMSIVSRCRNVCCFFSCVQLIFYKSNFDYFK